MPPPRRSITDADGKVKQAGEKAPKLVLRFQETPPGSVFGPRSPPSPLWSWFGSLAMGCPAGMAASPIRNTPGTAIGVSWRRGQLDGIRRKQASYFEGMLTARLSLAVTALVSLVATGLFLLDRQGPSHRKASVTPLTAGILGTTLWPWIVLAVAALFNAAYLSYRWGLNSWRFRYLAERDEPGGSVAKVRQPAERGDASQVGGTDVAGGARGIGGTSEVASG